MVCSSCGFEQLASFAVCPKCGRKQAAPCVACGFQCDPNFAFCPKCGSPRLAGERAAASVAAKTPLGPPQSTSPSNLLPIEKTGQQEADRRHVTVLFADLSGFTSLSERVDPEQLRSFQNALFEMLGRSVTQFGGFVAKFLGDAALALFGAPVAHEDDPERALAAALDMLTRTEELSENWGERLGQRVSLHIAVHTGPVVAGSFDDIAGGAYDVTGDTVNTASRLLGAATPGAIVVSEATASLTRHRFAIEAAGEVTVRGKSEPILVHRLLGALAKPQSARGLAAHGLSSPLVGRVEELQQLAFAFERMQRGQAQFVRVLGEAGTGKSRLITEFLARLDRDGARGITVRRVTCSSLGEPPLGVFSSLFREGYRLGTGDSIDTARRKLAAGLRSLGAPPNVEEAIVPVLSYLLGVEETQSRDFDPEQLKRQISLAARTLVEQRLEKGPLLIVVEDLQWADTASVELLSDILEHHRKRTLMLLVAHRPNGRAAVASDVPETTITLNPLSRHETRTLIAGLFGHMSEEAFGQIQQFVQTRAEGNPLFIEEIVRSLVDAGIVVRHDDRWVCETGLERVSIPPTLQGLLLSRVDSLPAGPRRLLREASVLGVEFDEMLLNAVAGSGQNNESALQHILHADLIQHAGASAHGKTYRFTHPLLREAVYENLLLSRRSEIHGRAGSALEAIIGPNPSRLIDIEALGHHWSLSSDKSKGARYLTAAGDSARTVYANADAIRHYERALRTLAESRAANSQLDTVRERLSDVLALSGKRAEAMAHYETVRQALRTCGDRAGCARLLRKIGVLHWETGDREQAKALFESGLKLLEEDRNPIERAQLLQEIGRFAFRSGDNERAIDWAQRALSEIAGEVNIAGDHERSRNVALIRAQAYNTLGVALARSSRLNEAIERIEQSIALAQSHDLLQAACRGYTNLGVLYSSLNPRRSIETCRRGIEIAKKVGDLGYQSQLYANLAVAYCALTDRCEAEGVEAAQIAIDLDRRLGLLDHLAVPLIVLGQIHQCHGDRSLAEASYQEALTLAERIGEPQLMFPCYDGLATLSLDAGNMSVAEMYFSKAREVCERAGVEPDELLMLPFLS